MSSGFEHDVASERTEDDLTAEYVSPRAIYTAASTSKTNGKQAWNTLKRMEQLISRITAATSPSATNLSSTPLRSPKTIAEDKNDDEI